MCGRNELRVERKDSMSSCVRQVRAFAGLSSRAIAFAFFALLSCEYSWAQNSSRPAADEKAYFELRPFSIEDLRGYIAAYPGGKYASDAQNAIKLLSDFEAIRSGSTKPGCEIKFEALGHYNDGTPAWDNASKANPERGAAGFFVSGNAAGIFTPIPGKGLSIRFGNSQRPVWPAGDGSIWGIDSGGNVIWLYPGVKVQTQGKLLLGVIADRGIVCISGVGSIIYADGTTIEIK
jgi:hypothetical protein